MASFFAPRPGNYCVDECTLKIAINVYSTNRPCCFAPEFEFRPVSNRINGSSAVLSPFHVPFLLDAAGRGRRVRGELYDVDEALLADLDALEGAPDFYQRRTIDVMSEQPDATPEQPGATAEQAAAYLLPPCHFASSLLAEAMLRESLEEYTLEEHLVSYIPPHERGLGRAEAFRAMNDALLAGCEEGQSDIRQ